MWEHVALMRTLPFLCAFLPALFRCHVATTSSQASVEHGFYSVTPLQIGIEIRGISLQTDPPPSAIAQIKQDVTEHRYVVFRDQGIISGKRQVEISKWFGELDSETFTKHPKSPHLDVFRLSNDPREGCLNVGREWHIDGTFRSTPYAYSLYHIINVPTSGDTVFLPLTELIENLDETTRETWERLYMVSDTSTRQVQPLIYAHPVTKKPVLCFHLGMTDQFAWDYGTKDERFTGRQETAEILNNIDEEIVGKNSHLIYRHKWRAGDFIISDNLALGHQAHPDTQLAPSIVGLRVVHRTTVKGTVPPAKHHTTTQTKEEL